jgi:23S rRNA (uracil1939-C5)-methyltransferase
MPGKNQHLLMIEKLVPGGFGLGRTAAGIVVLVRYVLPGEQVLVNVVSRKKDYITGVAAELLSTSDDRVVPPCPFYGRCGGCDLQHAGPGAQIRLKKAILAESLQRAGGDIFADLSPLVSPEQFGYRQRIRLQIDDNGIYGFYRAESHTLEPVSQCLLARDELNGVLRQLHNSLIFQELAKHCSGFELLFNPAEDTTVILLHFRRKPRPADCHHAKDLLRTTAGLAHVLMQVAGYGLYDPLAREFPAAGPIMSHSLALEDMHKPLVLSWETGGFCQVNLEQNKNLIQLVLEMVAAGPHKTVLDLYCGYGNFSLPIAQRGAEVLGIDAQNSAIRSGRRNAVQNRIHTCRFAKEQVPAGVSALVGAGRSFETIILDPPRQGALETISRLPELGPTQIVYISCNPATLARDLARLIPAGYELCRLVPVDMFPQTHHLESVALLKRSTP